jgi:hypothetical protein
MSAAGAGQGAPKRRFTTAPLGAGSAARPGAWRAELWEQIREVSRPLITYWIFLATMFGAFSVAAMLEGPSLESFGFLACLALTTFSCVAVGQALALLRVRDWVLFTIWGLTWTVGSVLGMMGAVAVSFVAAPLAVLIFCYVFFGPMFLLGGAWSVATNRALYSTWVPILYASASAIIMAERKGKVATWMAGEKWAVWDVFTFGVLGAGIALLLAFLVSRESHRLHLWRRNERGLLRGSVKEEGAARPRLSCLGWLMLCVLAGGLAIGTAAVAPFLWRTGPSDKGEETDQQDPQKDKQKDKKKDKKKDKGKDKGKDKKKDKGKDKGKGEPDKSWRDKAKHKVSDVGEEVEQNLEPVVQQGVDLLSTIITMLILGLLAFFLFYRPVKRLLTIRHLRRPYWAQLPTDRIEQGWRLVEIALGDAGVEPVSGEPAVSYFARAEPALHKLVSGAPEVHGLWAAAQIRDRVVFGLGVGPDDLALMDRVSGWAYDTVWDRLQDRGQIKALYRGI